LKNTCLEYSDGETKPAIVTADVFYVIKTAWSLYLITKHEKFWHLPNVVVLAGKWREKGWCVLVSGS
jgi:hypothetical protein